VEIPAGFQSDVAQEKSDTVKIYNYEGEMKSEFATEKVEKYMKDYRDKVSKERLAAKNFRILSSNLLSEAGKVALRKSQRRRFRRHIGYMVIPSLHDRRDVSRYGTSPPAKKSAAPWKPSFPVRSPACTSSWQIFSDPHGTLGTAALSVLSMGVSFSSWVTTQKNCRGRDAAAGLLLRLGPKTVISVFLIGSSRCRPVFAT